MSKQTTQTGSAIERAPCIDRDALLADAELKINRKVMARYARAPVIRNAMKELPGSTWHAKFNRTTPIQKRTARNMRIAEILEAVEGPTPWSDAPRLIGHHLQQAREFVENGPSALKREVIFQSPIEEVRQMVFGTLAALRNRIDPVFAATSLEVDPQRVFERPYRAAERRYLDLIKSARAAGLEAQRGSPAPKYRAYDIEMSGYLEAAIVLDNDLKDWFDLAEQYLTGGICAEPIE